MKVKSFYLILWLLYINFVFSDENELFHIKQIQENMDELFFNDENNYSKVITDYFDLYKLNYENSIHHFGFFYSNNYKIATHCFLPNNGKYEKIVILMHGFFDHTGVLNNLIELLINKNYAVFVYDMPGHGLSSGERVHIDSFTTYANVFDDFIKIIKKKYNKPLFLIGHSTGCSAIFEYLSTTNENHFIKIIFLAPLIRSNHWFISKIGLNLVSPFKKFVPRTFRKNSGDIKFLSFQKNKDFLQPKIISLKWFKALTEWNKKILTYEPLKYSILIIQGNNDIVIDWKYNLKLLKTKINDVKIEVIDKANHQLTNESYDIKIKVFSLIETYLNQN